MAKTSIHFVPVKSGSEIHNLREKELDYVIKELTPNNEHWVDPRYEGQTLADIRKEIADRYQTHVGQKMQAKAAPIREAVIVIKPDTTMADLQLLAKQLEKEFGIKCIQLHIHRDEGFSKDNPDPSKLNLHAHFVADWTHANGTSLRLTPQDTSKMQTIGAECLKMERGSSSNVKHLNAVQYKEKKALENISSLRKLVYKSFLSQNAKNALYKKIDQLVEDLKADPMNIQLQQQVEQLTEKVTQLQADIERRKQQREQDQKTISALREENAQLRRNNEKNASFNENLRKENRDLKRKAYPERYVLPSFINVDATRIYKDKQGQCHIAMMFTGGSKEYSEKMSNEDFMAFKNGDLTKEEVIAKYYKPLIEGYIRREFSRPEKRSAALSLIENTIFDYMKLYASSTFVPSSNGDNNPRKRRNYDDIDDINEEERKGMAYK
ncbi:hypothetical protein L6468_06480 [Prevotella communis]|uniref:hypothetical protein n=1 Tax=Prevotella communis TaxID=2913614 RepID=UPI001EDAB3B9|nr:hypothetical protein [Prevotella communis]UKK63395.1 hypothetical protein L6468_06480 [Prevotella communis]UKK66221.1 hypothetical protein L6473_06485 [Prevotella communis]